MALKRAKRNPNDTKIAIFPKITEIFKKSPITYGGLGPRLQTPVCDTFELR